ncbi:hypothetical protein BH09SUM1_BH09SUM1_05930 [soil metagenome]
MADSVFKDPENVRKQLNLPSVVSYSFIGDSTPEYHAKLDEIMTRIALDANIQSRGFKESRAGKYTAYRYEVFHADFADIEAIYREVMALPGTKFVV